MTDHTISVDDAKVPATLSFSPVFNCAVHFIDRHIDEGRADKIAIREVGAPNLTDGIWLYGSDLATIKDGIRNGRGAVMPPWVDRLDPVTLKSLAVYVHSLGGGE